MTNLSQLTTSQLHQILAIKEKIEALQGQIATLAAGGDDVPIPYASEAPAPGKRKYHMSAAHRRKLIKALAKARKIRWAKLKAKAKNGKRRLSAAGKAAIIAATKARWARWAKVKGKTASPQVAKKKDRRSSPAVRAKLAAAAKARWAKAKAEGKTTL
jgi:hypothetical protein